MANKKGTSLLPIVLVTAGVALILGALFFYLVNPFNSSDAVPTDQAAGALPYPDVARVSLKDAKAALDLNNAVFVDVRGEPYFSEEHIPGALSITYDELPAHLQDLKKADWIIPYCTWPSEESSARVAQYLLDNGFSKVTPILGGFNAWKDAGYPVEP